MLTDRKYPNLWKRAPEVSSACHHSHQTWSEQNSMKAEILNVFLNYRDKYDDDVLVYDVCIKPPDHLWF